MRQLRIHAAADDLGYRDSQPLRAAAHLAVPIGLKLYLKAHHDGIIIPSSVVFRGL
jgi:hypothetical protein